MFNPEPGCIDTEAKLYHDLFTIVKAAIAVQRALGAAPHGTLGGRRPCKPYNRAAVSFQPCVQRWAALASKHAAFTGTKHRAGDGLPCTDAGLDVQCRG